jgi:UDP-N-acetylglucosamine--N-acetylmuramyl-(pentapeptide) pyrophosphoryl-undecaprenol N-acetylglucosamine transferase
MKELKRVLIVAGGTGGHVFPGLAIAQSFRDKGIDVHWLGTSKGIEARLVPETGFPLHLVTISGVRGKGLKSLLKAPFSLVAAVRQAKQVISDVCPDLVLGLGGFVSGPGGIASWLMKKPLVIHEQNAKAGLTNKVLARIATRVLAGFPSAFPASRKVDVVGNPVRVEIENLPSPDERLIPYRSPMRFLVLGGSLGAKALNDVVPHMLAKLAESHRPEVLHQAGDKHIEETKNLYKSMGMQADVQAFIKDMARAYSWADVVLCRAGALTVAELCAAGLGAIFVPYPLAVDDHQTANANFMVKEQAALCIQQAVLTAEQLADIVGELSRLPEKRLAMARSAYQLRRVGVVEKIYEICREVCR